MKMVAGNNTTSATRITLGSHIDDVINIQGTPIKIDNSVTSLGYYTWYYGTYTYFKISTADNKVTAWDNSNGNLIVQ